MKRTPIFVTFVVVATITLASAQTSLKATCEGNSADEIETSMILYMDPTSVDMKKAVKDYHPSGKGGLTRDPKGEAAYSASGIWGDPTLATRDTGRIVTEALVEGILKEIEALRRTPIR